MPTANDEKDAESGMRNTLHRAGEAREVERSGRNTTKMQGPHIQTGSRDTNTAAWAMDSDAFSLAGALSWLIFAAQR